MNADTATLNHQHYSYLTRFVFMRGRVTYNVRLKMVVQKPQPSDWTLSMLLAVAIDINKKLS